MNRDHEVFVESIAKEGYRRLEVLRNLQVPVSWEYVPEKDREAMMSLVRSMIEDGYIIPGRQYSGITQEQSFFLNKFLFPPDNIQLPETD